MRPDQVVRLQELSEQLADRFILEADPREWPGDGKGPADMTQQERGDAYWCKKNAMATGGVLRFVLDAVAKHAPEGGGGEGGGEGDLDRVVKEAESKAKQLVDAAVARAKGKPVFDARTHGKR